MLLPPIGSTLDPSLRILSLPLDMIDDAPVMRSGMACPPARWGIAPANLIIMETPCEAPFFREAMSTASARTRRDVVLVHTGFWPETVDRVTVDVALIGPDGPLVLADLIFMRGRDRRLWLAPQGTGLFVETSRSSCCGWNPRTS